MCKEKERKCRKRVDKLLPEEVKKWKQEAREAVRGLRESLQIKQVA